MTGYTARGLPPSGQEAVCLHNVLMSVQCCADATNDCANARVISIGLSGQQLRGSLPDAIGSLGALSSLKLHDNFLTGTFPSSLGRLHWLRELQLSHNQFAMQARESLSSILGGMLFLSTLDLGMSDEKEDLGMSVITPAPPLDCRVGEPCEFTLSTRTQLGLALPHGGLSIALNLRTGSTTLDTQPCSDMMNGAYACTFPAAWIATEGELEFGMSADSEEFEPIRTLVDPSTGTESTAPTYSSLTAMVDPIVCAADHSHPETDGSACVCETGYYRREFGDGQWSCGRCGRGEEPTSDGNRCSQCAYGKYSPDGVRCEVCQPGSSPNKQVSADSCQECDDVSVSPHGVACNRCPPEEKADSSHTTCVCPVTMYNSSKAGGNMVRCLSQGLRGDDQAAPSECVPCGDLECVDCGAGGLVVRAEYSVAQIDQPWLVFKCPFEGACQNTAEQRCKVGHTGLLCAVCEDGYGLDRDDCVECSATNSNPYTAGALFGAACVVAAMIYFWRRRGCGGVESNVGLSGLIANPLQVGSSSTPNLRVSSSSSSGGGKAAAVAQKSSDLYTLLRVVYQPVRIIVGYIQVVTQIGPVLDLEFPRYIRALLEALKPFMIDLQSILQLDCLSDGLLDFYATWIVRVFVIPLAMLGIVGLQYCYERRKVGHGTAAGTFKANAFVVVFLCYPGVCNQAFGMFNCRTVGVDLSVLVKDYSIHCSTEKHTTFQVIAGLYIAAVAFGIPLRMARLMFKRMQEYGGGSASDKFVARRVGDELKLDDQVAADAIRDCSTGREYSFLVNAFKPRYYFWEGRRCLGTPFVASREPYHPPVYTRSSLATHMYRLRHDPEADAGRDAGGRRPRQCGAALSRDRNQFYKFFITSAADAVPARRGQRAEGRSGGAYLPSRGDRAGAQGAALRGRRRADSRIRLRFPADRELRECPSQPIVPVILL